MLDGGILVTITMAIAVQSTLEAQSHCEVAILNSSPEGQTLTNVFLFTHCIYLEQSDEYL